MHFCDIKAQFSDISSFLFVIITVHLSDSAWTPQRWQETRRSLIWTSGPIRTLDERKPLPSPPATVQSESRRDIFLTFWIVSARTFWHGLSLTMNLVICQKNWSGQDSFEVIWFLNNNMHWLSWEMFVVLWRKFRKRGNRGFSFVD